MDSKGLASQKRSRPVGEWVVKKRSSATEPKKPLSALQKVIIVGDVNSGKSCLVHRYIHREFGEVHPMPTVGMLQTIVKEKKICPNGVRYSLWDTGGSEKFRSIVNMHYRGTDVVLLVYDVTSESTFEAIEQSWRKDLIRHVPEAPVILVGNKCDLEDKRVIPTETGAALAANNGYMFMETSAATGHNVDNLFRKTAFTLARLQRSNHLELSDSTLRHRVRLADTAPEQPSRSCCLTS